MNKAQMNKAQMSKESKSYLDAVLHQRIITIDAPEREASATGFSLNNLSAIRFVMGDASTLFFSAVSVYLADGLEVFVLDVSQSLDLRKYSGGPPISWQCISQFSDKFSKVTVENIKFVSAEWHLVTGNGEKSYYGNSPQILVCDTSGEAGSYIVEDGLILSADNAELIVSTANTLSETLSLRYTSFW